MALFAVVVEPEEEVEEAEDAPEEELAEVLASILDFHSFQTTVFMSSGSSTLRAKGMAVSLARMVVQAVEASGSLIKASGS